MRIKTTAQYRRKRGHFFMRASTHAAFLMVAAMQARLVMHHGAKPCQVGGFRRVAAEV